MGQGKANRGASEINMVYVCGCGRELRAVVVKGNGNNFNSELIN